MFKGGTRDYIVINKQGCASWLSKKRRHHFVFTKLLLKEAIKILLHNCFFSIANIIMIQVIGIPIESDPLRLLGNLFLAHKKDDLLRHNVSLEQSVFKRSIISLGLLMAWYHYIKTILLRNTITIFIQQN